MTAFLTSFWRSSTVRLSLSSSIIRAGGLGMTLLISVTLARMLGPTGLGYYSFALAVVTVAGLALHAGLSTLIMRETAKEEARSNWSKVAELWRWGIKTIGWLSLAILSATGLTFFTLGERITLDAGTPTVLVGLLLIPLIAIAQMTGGAVRGLHRPVLGLLPDSVLRPITLLGSLIVVWASGAHIDALTAMQIHVLCAVLAAAFGAILIYQLRPDAIKSAVPSGQCDPRWSKALFPLALLAGTQILFQNTTLVMLGFWYPAEELGLFKVAISASNLVILGLTAINMIMAPSFVKLYALNDRVRLQQKAALSALLAFAAALACAAVLTVFGETILALLFGKAFILAYTPLLILIGGQLCGCWFGCAANLLNMADHEMASLKVTGAVLIINLMLSAMLIPVHGIVGAAVATAISIALCSIALGIVVRYKLAIKPTPLGLIATFLANHAKPTDQASSSNQT